MCSVIIKESIAYYINNGSTVYYTVLDTTEAFDRVEHCKLFKLFNARAIPPVIIRLLLNIYTRHLVRISQTGVNSNSFAVQNGVKQGVVISPVPFCIYIDKLLFNLEANGIGCFIGEMFVRALAYADDIVFIAPTSRAMRRILSTCDSFGYNFSIVLNVKKSKCLISEPTRKAGSFINPKPAFTFEEMQLRLLTNCLAWTGHIIDNRSDDGVVISCRRSSMMGQINSVLCYFNQVDVVPKLKLLKSYCSSLYLFIVL